MIAALQSADRAALLTWTKVLVFVSIVFATASPFTAPILVAGAFAVQAFWIARDHGDLWLRLRGIALTRGWIAFAVFFLYLALRLLEFPIAVDAIPGVAAMGAFALLTFATCALYSAQNKDVQTATAQAILAAFAASATLHAFEIATDMLVRRQVWRWLPMFRPRAGKIELDGDTVRLLVPFIANPTSAILMALFWPVLLLARRMPLARVTRAMTAVGAVFCVYAVLRSDQATSKMALLAGVLMWGVVSLVPRSAKPLLTALWIGSNVLVLPLAIYAYAHDWYKLPPNFSAQHRVVLWGVTAEKTLAHPWFGIGTGRTSDYDESTSSDVKYVPGTRIPIATNRHAHNVFLQLWYEDGAVGVVLFLLAGLPVIGWIAAAPPKAQALLAAAFASTIVSASLSYSLLAAWFLATFAITALFCRFALSVTDAEP